MKSSPIFVLRFLQPRCDTVQKRVDSRQAFLTEFKLARAWWQSYTEIGVDVSCRVFHEDLRRGCRCLLLLENYMDFTQRNTQEFDNV